MRSAPILILIAATLVASQADEQFVEIAGPAGRIGGTLTMPATTNHPVPAVVTLTGSGAHFRDGNRSAADAYRPFKEIAGQLASCGVATLRADDRGVGVSAGDANAATAEDTAADARAMIQFVRRQPHIDPARVVLLGHSYGGEIAPIVAAGDPTLAAVVLLGAPARNFRETMRYQWRYRIENDRSIAADKRAAALDRAMQQQEVSVRESREAWRRSIQDLDPLVAASQLRMPVLILHGTTDRAVDPADARMLERTIRSNGNTHVETHIFKGLNHHFNVDPLGATDRYALLPSQAVAPVMLNTLCNWLRGLWS